MVFFVIKIIQSDCLNVTLLPVLSVFIKFQFRCDFGSEHAGDCDDSRHTSCYDIINRRHADFVVNRRIVRLFTGFCKQNVHAFHENSEKLWKRYSGFELPGLVVFAGHRPTMSIEICKHSASVPRTNIIDTDFITAGLRIWDMYFPVS